MNKKQGIHALQVGIRKRGNPLGVTLLHFLQLDWPDSDVVITRMSDFIASSGIPSSEVSSLVCSITEQSLKAYGETLFSVSRSKKNHDPFRVAAFIDHLITEVTQLLCDGIGKGLTAAIDQESGEAKWHCNRQLTDTDKDQLRVFMYHLFVKDELKLALRRSNYEQTLLAGAFDSVYSDFGRDDSCSR